MQETIAAKGWLETRSHIIQLRCLGCTRCLAKRRIISEWLVHSTFYIWLASLERISCCLRIKMMRRCAIVLAHISWWEFFILFILNLLSHVWSTRLSIVVCHLLSWRWIISPSLSASSLKTTRVRSIWITIRHNKVILAIEPWLIMFVCMWNNASMRSILDYHWIVIGIWGIRLIVCRVLIMMIIPIN